MLPGKHCREGLEMVFLVVGPMDVWLVRRTVSPTYHSVRVAYVEIVGLVRRSDDAQRVFGPI